MSRNTSRVLRWGVSAVIVVFLILFARSIAWSQAWHSIRSASPPLLLGALTVNLLSLAAKGFRWWVFLRPAGSSSLSLAMRATVAGAGLNNVLVANGGDAARVVFVSRASGIPSERVLATLALERLFDPVGFVILIVVGTLVFDLPPSLEKWRYPAELLLAVIAVLLALLVFSSRRTGPVTDEGVVARDLGAGSRIKRYVSGFAASTRSLTSGGRFGAALVLSMLAWAGQLATFALAASAAHVSIPVAGSLATLLAINLGLVIRATPGNVGFFQFVYALTAEQFGVARTDAIAVSLLIQTLQIIPLTLVGVALAPEFIFRRSRG
ncbi:MAG: lysylphosphatidylglycerol synthase transmembrane domain-containing protein [Gemmatimonadaceae bacterium]|nr:lysylphosphatidylglycerol synthase transmembrane domain-containing protein [Gemmatimonadaceae bacterium]